MAQIGGRSVATNDIGVIASGAVMFIVGFLPWYSVSYSFFGRSTKVHENGWGLGFNSWFPVLLVLAVAGLLVARLFASLRIPDVGPVSALWILPGASAFASLLLLIRWIRFPDAPKGLDAGPSYGFYLALIAAIAQTVFGVLAALANGATIPGRGRAGWPGRARSLAALRPAADARLRRPDRRLRPARLRPAPARLRPALAGLRSAAGWLWTAASGRLRPAPHRWGL
ncbi:hypothetical protein [Candidatus Frankia alpina]|uniref:hypothetical protein n=1 Tax=Candidatus Frankia alpina TaxID=2699483 RepID=UPI001F22678B|nr:hypothetical protein [Candidatus Frankia alpina]